ncbi:unnamed protein product, partial [Urochloa humidicola]
AAATTATAPPKKLMSKVGVVVAAAAATALCGLGLAAQAAVSGLLGGLWVTSAANAAHIALCWAYGAGSRAEAVALDFLLVATAATGMLFLVLVFVVAALVLLVVVLRQLVRCRRGANRKGEAQEIGGDGSVTMPAAQGTRDGVIYGPVTKPIAIVLFVVMAVGLLMVVLAPAKGLYQQRIGTMLVHVGSFLLSLMFCLVIFPRSAIETTAAWVEVRKACAEVATLFRDHSSFWAMQPSDG